MANIKNELNKIKNAVYGKEVRGSIHDGIKKINEESEESKGKADEAHDVMESIIQEGFDNAVIGIQDALSEADLPALEQAVTDLETAIDNLNDAIENIPIYEKATESKDGLMSKEDKTKINRINVTSTTDLDGLRNKLNLITVTSPADLNDMLSRIEALEN